MKNKFSFTDDGIFSRRTYSGLIEGKPNREMTDREISDLKKIAKSFCWIKPYVHLDIDIDERPLRRIAYVAWVTSSETIAKDNGCTCGSHACIIWFEDKQQDARVSMYKMLEDLGEEWETIAENWDY